MNGEERMRASEELARLLDYWKEIEFWIKKAEQVSGEAVIPAINELRYASRQIFQAVRLLQNEALSEDDIQMIKRRLTVGEQYLINADHDVCDAIVTYFATHIRRLDNAYGKAKITTFFIEYPSLRQRVIDCYNLIANSRGEYNDRQKNYGEIRSNHFTHILDCNQKLIDAEVSAKIEKYELERELVIVKGRINIMEKFNIVTGLCTIIAIPLAIYLWMVGPKSFCASHSGDVVFGYLCRFAATDDSSAANNPSTDGTLGP
jgi:hypothetical protein